MHFAFCLIWIKEFLCIQDCNDLSCEPHEKTWGVSGVTVSMVAFQAVDPGSTPGWRMTAFTLASYMLMGMLGCCGYQVRRADELYSHLGPEISQYRCKTCIGRESNPGRPRGRRAFYHWTTDARTLTPSRCILRITLQSYVLMLRRMNIYILLWCTWIWKSFPRRYIMPYNVRSI